VFFLLVTLAGFTAPFLMQSPPPQGMTAGLVMLAGVTGLVSVAADLKKIVDTFSV